MEILWKWKSGGGRPLPVLCALLALLLPTVTAPTGAQESPPQRPELPEPHPDLPDEFQQLLPRGRIASVDQPEFVDAEKAEISDDAWILGVVIEGQAKAYSLNLLNRHEVVNDRQGETAFAAVW